MTTERIVTDDMSQGFAADVLREAIDGGQEVANADLLAYIKIAVTATTRTPSRKKVLALLDDLAASEAAVEKALRHIVGRCFRCPLSLVYKACDADRDTAACLAQLREWAHEQQGSKERG